MAPEVVASKGNRTNSGYDSRVDVWAIGITAIELADGKAPFQDMHPTRALFQIVRNPPPTLYRPTNWSENFNDFISEYTSSQIYENISLLRGKRHDHVTGTFVSDAWRRILRTGRT